MTLPTVHSDPHADEVPANFGHKLRPASHTYFRYEGTVLWGVVIVGFAALLVLTKLWLIQLLG
jgi:hypothetical protein